MGTVRWLSGNPGDGWLDRASRLAERIVSTPVHITAFYLLFGVLALFVSDVLLVWYFDDPLLARIQLVKGAIEIVLTAGLIYVLTNVSQRSMQRLSEERKRQREELSVLHRVLRHNLRNDINLIHGHALDLEAELDDPEAAERASVIHRKTADMLEYTTRAGRLRRITESDDAMTPIDLTTTVEAVLEDHPGLTDDVVVATDLPGRCDVRANHMLETALEELITNALEYHDGDNPTITIDVRPDDGPVGYAEVVVGDDGPGVPEMVTDAISESGPDQLVHLDGMGLWFVTLTVRESGGDVDIEAGDSGTTVRLTLPRHTETDRSLDRLGFPGR
jgi:signal transduction histidine kinase